MDRIRCVIVDDDVMSRELMLGHCKALPYVDLMAYYEGQKQYELTNHLGNVMVTVSDKKIPVDTASLGYAQYYLPNIISAQDYYPFGMEEPGRSYAIIGDSSYRFGFNGMLHDNDIYGKDNSYD